MYVHVNAAVSVDGKLSTPRREQVRISGPEDFDRVDEIRAEADAVAVGVGTVLADDPRLGLDDSDRAAARREAGRPPAPARVVFDSRARTPSDARLLAGDAETYVLASEAAPTADRERLRAAGATVLVAGEEQTAPQPALAALADHGVDRLMVEGGGELIFSLFDAGVVDELTVYVGSLVIGGRDAPTLADGEGFVDRASFPELALQAVDRLDDGVVLSYAVE
ncbi:2,5-diamino-6-(ribosylamino)-4(3H)-pyrimidinone 5'-phosphate reductase [Halobaculum sp. MBLA0143]|uniref:2,5-diamino-6-(ribosylamino)-4(3H)-pyrimidinone 5'-phosphate reductase n=1 Tax=Halobaculum sp. MBLA0143 TaxID=3079933 RepID=UPI0035253AEB